MRAIGGEEARDFEFSSHDLLVEVGGLWVLEGQEAADHGVEHDSTAPDVALQAEVLLAGDHLGGGIAGRAASCLQQAIRWLVEVAESEVDDFQRLVEVEEQVFRLQITMADAALVDVLNTRDELLEDADGSLLVEALMLHDVVEQLSVHAVLHDQVELGLRLDNLGKE